LLKLKILARASPQVVYAHLKWMWASSVREEALGFLRDFTARMSNNDRVGNTGLLARCYLKKGEWQKFLQEDWDRVYIQIGNLLFKILYTLIILIYYFRKLFPIFYNLIYLQHNMIKIGIKLGMHGLSQTLRLFLFMRN